MTVAGLCKSTHRRTHAPGNKVEYEEDDGGDDDIGDPLQEALKHRWHGLSRFRPTNFTLSLQANTMPPIHAVMLMQ